MTQLYLNFFENYTENQEFHLEVMPAPRSLKFGSKLHGGYNSAAVDIPGPRDVSLTRFRKLLSSHMIVYDEYYRRIWEGRVEDAEVNKEGVNLGLTGYFAHASEILHGLIYPGGVGTETYAHDIVTDTMNLTAQSFGSERTWATGDYRIQQTDVDLGYQDFSGEVKAIEAIERATRYGYTQADLRPIYFVIYNNRECRLFPEPSLPPNFETDVDWFVPSGVFRFDGSWSVSHTRKSIWNKVWYLWDDNAPDSIGPTLSSSAKEDTWSQKVHGIREAVVNVTQVPEAVADLVTDIFIARNAHPRQSFKGTIQGRVRHISGKYEEPYMIKAGDIVVIEDMDVNLPIGKVTTGEGANSVAGFITKTDYNFDSNTLQIDVGTDDKTLDVVLSRWGIGGGLV